MLTHLLSLQHGDSAFPSGGFAFSNGVEGLADLGALDEGALTQHVAAAIRHRWAGMDRVALVAAYRAAGDVAALARIDAAIEAATLAETLRVGSRRHGQSFLTSHVRLQTPGAALLRDAVRSGVMIGHIVTLQGALWQALGLTKDAAVAMSGYQAVSSLTTAAVRLGRIGAIEAQRVMAASLPLVAAAAKEPIETLGLHEPDALVLTSFIPLIEIAAARHAHADLRLFSN